MKLFRGFFVGAVLAMVSACSSLPTAMDQMATAPPAPLAQTQIDDKALITAYKAFDAVLYSVDTLRSAKVIVDGSPKAFALAGHLDAARHWLNAATEAQRLGQTDNYAAAMGQATAAFIAIRKALE